MGVPRNAGARRRVAVLVNRQAQGATRARLAWLREVRRGLPATASVVVSNHVGAHFTARDTVFMYPGVKDADWLILHRMDVSPKGGAVDVGRLTRRGYVLEAQWADEIFVLRRIEP